MKTKIILAITVATTSLISCNKEPKPDILLSDETKNYLMQPVGSWWIYEDSVTGILDTVRLTDQGIEVWEDSNIYYEYLRNTFHSSIRGQFANITVPEDRVILFYRPDIYIQGIEIGQEISSSNSYIAFYPSFEINGNIYYNVKYYGRLINPSSYSKWYWAENIGLIKVERLDVAWSNDYKIVDTLLNENLKLKTYYINN